LVATLKQVARGSVVVAVRKASETIRNKKHESKKTG
jgi:hypothetical protein